MKIEKSLEVIDDDYGEIYTKQGINLEVSTLRFNVDLMFLEF